MTFARWLGRREIKVRFFADADFDGLLGIEFPEKVWITDSRDMEWYVLHEPCLDKVLKLGVATEILTANDLLETVRAHGRRLGFLRLLSEIESLKLPFQKTDLHKKLHFVGSRLNLNFNGYVQALLEKAGISLKRKDFLIEKVASLENKYVQLPDSEIIHGKDAFCITGKVLSRYGLEKGDVSNILWTSFEKAFVVPGSTLQTVLQYLEGALF